MKEERKMKSFSPKRLLFLLSWVMISVTTVLAQSRTVSGIVKDESGETVISATILVKGTTIGTVTDYNGFYKIDVPASAKTLVFSYVGMKPKEVAINGNTINVTLESDTKVLEDLVVIGYGTQRKKDLTGSVSSVNEKALKDIPVATVAEALTGKLTGVQVTTTEGSPDADIKIRVRGGGSITQSNSPLYIVDGFAKDDIKDIAPSEIISIDVLKDASSTAIYGSRGANGVVMITTKSGQQGKLSVNYSGYAGIKQISNILDVLSPYQFVQKQYERAMWNNTVPSDYERYFGHFGDINLYNYVNGTNWQQETFGRTGFTQNHTLTLSGGSKELKYNASYSHIDDKAIMVGSDYRRDNLSLKLNYDPLKWLKLDLSVRYAGTQIKGSGANDQTGSEKSTSDSRVKNAVVYTPIPLTNLVSQDDDAEALANLYSPLQMTADNDRIQNNTDFNVNGGFTIKINKNLSFKSTIGVNNAFKDDSRFYGLSTYYVREGGARKREVNGMEVAAPAILLTDSRTTTFQNTNILNYKKDNIIKGHNLSVVLGQETFNRSFNSSTSNVEAFPLEYTSQQAWGNLAEGTSVFNKLFYDMDERMISFFGRMNYDINGKYLFAATLRADGSSKFSGKNKWGYFPSFSAGWRISDEKFMAETQGWLSNLKLRASYGESGNNRIGNSAFKRTYGSSNSAYLPSSYYDEGTQGVLIYTAGSTLANPDLKWETTVTRNAGIDFGFFKDRINGSIEAYSNSTEGVLIKMIIGGVGYTDQWQNAATTANKGVELTLNAALIQKKNFNLNFSFNISANENTVVDLGGLSTYSFNEAWTSMSEGSNSYIVSPGNPVGLIYGYVNEGFYKADDFTWNGSKWGRNTAKYSTEEVLADNSKIYKDAEGNIFVDNSTIAGYSWGPGAMKLKDKNGDGKITDLDREVIGNTNPKHFGSFSFSGDYKNVDFSVNFNWVYGNSIYNANKIELSSQYYKFRNMLAVTQNSYTQIDWATGNRITDAATLDAVNANADIWAAPTGRYVTTKWAIEDGSFLRLNNITLGYSVPSRFIKKLKMEKLRVYGTAYNLFMLTNYSGYDPEVDTRRSSPATPGVDYSAYPKSRTYNLGLNITF
jgi:TonB-linked SusC/RagA family outer membrane protein